MACLETGELSLPSCTLQNTTEVVRHSLEPRGKDMVVESNSNAKVMVVDDIPMMRLMLAKFVKALGRKVFEEVDGCENARCVDIIEASNGKVALEKLQKNKVSVIFLDLMMPEMDGVTFLGHKNADPALADVPVIVCSAIGEVVTREKVEEFGVKGYITKPFTMKTLETKLRETLINAPE